MNVCLDTGLLLRSTSPGGGDARIADATPGIRLQAGSHTAGFHGSGLAAILVALLGVLLAGSASAHGYGHRHHAYERGHGGIQLSLGYGRHHRYHRRSRHYGSYRRHRGSSVYFSYSAPLYVAPRYYYEPAPVVIHERPVVRVAPRQLPDMPDLAYTPQQGQDQAQSTADRQACESIAWRSSRPGAAVTATRTTRTTRTMQQVPGYAYPDSPIPAAAGGAALGALGGAIAGDAGAGAAIGAAVGAASWLLGAASAPPRSFAREVVVTEYVPVAGPDPHELRSRLIGCMHERGYAVVLRAGQPFTTRAATEGERVTKSDLAPALAAR